MDSKNNEKFVKINQIQNDTVAKLKAIEHKLLKVLKVQKEALDKLTTAYDVMKKRSEIQKQPFTFSKYDFKDQEEEKKFKNMPPLDTEKLDVVDWDGLLKELQ